MSSEKLEAGTLTTMASTELNSLANNAAALGSVVFDNAADLWPFAQFELTVTFGSAPTANYTIDLYLIPSIDGTNYDDAVTGANGTAPATSYAGAFPLRAITTIQRVPLGIGGQAGRIELPPSKFKILAVNKSGAAMPSSGSLIKMQPYRRQIV